MLSVTKAVCRLGRVAPLGAIVVPCATAATASPYKLAAAPLPTLPKLSEEELASTIHRIATEAANSAAPRSPTVPLFRAPGHFSRQVASSKSQVRRREQVATDAAILAATQQAHLQQLFAPVAVEAGSFAASSPEAPLVFGADLALKFRVVDAVLSELNVEIGSPRLHTIASVNDLVAEITGRIERKAARKAANAAEPALPANVRILTSKKVKEFRH